MGTQADHPVSAQVVLSTSDPDAARSVREHFASAGFEVGPIFGNSFAISGAADHFQRHFGGSSEPLTGGRGEPGEHNLETGKLPDTVKNKVSAILVTKPPDFGPTGGY